MALLLAALALVSCKEDFSGSFLSSVGEKISLSTSSTSLVITEGSSATVVILLNKPAPQDVELAWTIAGTGSDFAPASGTTTLAKGQDSASLGFSVPNNAVYTGDRTYTLVISGQSSVFSSSASLPLVVVEDDPASGGPEAPTFISTTPASPSSDSSPSVKGGTSTGTATVRLFSESSCVTQIGSGSRADFESGGLDVTVGANATTSIYARAYDSAGNGSSCTLLTTFDHDDQAPMIGAFSVTNSSPTKATVYQLNFTAAGSPSHYCILENDADPNHCAWSALPLPPSFTVSSANGSKILSAWVKDLAGNRSARSDSASVELDTSAPAAPTGLALQSPSSSPGTDASPTIRVSGVTIGDTVSLYTDSSCSVPSFRGSELVLGPNVDVTAVAFGSDGSFNFYATATDPAGNSSSCSNASVSYLYDTGAPPAPSALALQSPSTSPFNDTTPTVRISGVTAGDTIELFTDSSCSAPALRGSAVASGSTVDITASALGSDASYTFYSRATDPANNTSACSTASVGYQLDTSAPSAPSGLALQSPASSPANDTTPTIRVSGVASGDTVSLFSGSTCAAGTLRGSGTASGASIDITSSALSGDTTYAFYAKSVDPSGNASSCSSASVSYQLDTTAPTAPSGLSLQVPSSSPGQDTTPTIRVSGVTIGDTISLYTDSSCSSPSLRGSEVALATTVDITSGAFSSDATYAFYARATDPSGNSSVCSSASVSYVLDTAAPSAPSGLALQSPASSPANDTTPTIRVSGVVSGDTIELFTDNACSAPALVGSAIASGTTVDISTSALSSDATYAFYARATDAAANSSSCSSASVSYQLDSTAPSVPSGLARQSPAGSPANDTTPTIRVSGIVSGDTVGLYTDSSCSSGELRASGTAAGTTIDLTSSALPSDGTYSFYAKSTDPVGNSSSCSSAVVTYQLDTTAPSAPSGLALQSPSSSPGNDSTPTIRVSGVASGDSVELFSESACGTLVGSATASGPTVDITTNALSLDGTFSFYAKATDAVGNASSCSTATVSYALDTQGPTSPSISIENGATTTTSSTVTLTLAATGADQMYVTNTSTCTSGGSWESYATSKPGWTLGQSDATATVYVKFRDNAGNETSCINDSIVHDGSGPTAPTNLTLGTVPESLDTTPTLSWTAATDGGSGINHHEVQVYRALDNTVLQSWTTLASGSSVNNLFFTHGSQYYVKVRAIDNIGNVGAETTSGNWTATAPSGTLYGFGSYKTSGELGIGVTGYASGPLASNATVAGGIKFVKVTAQSSTSCGVTSSGIGYCWGYNGFGNIGDNTYLNNKYVPTPVSGSHVWSEISSQGGYSCGVRTDGAGYCWGYGSTGRLGDGTNNASRYVPTAISGGITWSKIVTGVDHACGIASGGTASSGALYCWGAAIDGKLGNNTTSGDKLVPTAVVDGGGITWTQLSAGDSHTCGITSAGAAYCWGNNSNGKLGVGDTVVRSVPTLVSGSLVWSKISAGRMHTCGITTGGDAYCWGYGYNGRLGNNVNTTSNYSSPVQVNGGLKWTAISAGYEHTCGITDTNQQYCWGANAYGQIGDGTYTDRLVPTLVLGGHTWSSIAVGMRYTCGVTSANTTYCWGDPTYGGTGNGRDHTIGMGTPLNLRSGLRWAGVASGEGSHSCALTTDGAAYCWGKGSTGQLGNGGTADSSTPVLVSSGYTWIQVSTGTDHSCGIRNTGQAYCWGNQNAGRLGNGSSTNISQSTPQLVSGGLTWASISAGNAASCGLTTSGDAYCWGDGSYGVLGTGNTSTSNVPALVTGGYKWKAVSTYRAHACGITTADDLYCWGYNYYGQLGNNTTSGSTANPTPVLVSGSMKWLKVSAGYNSTCGITTAGVGYCWGHNNIGNLGIGVNTVKYVPTAIAGNYDFKNIWAGDYHVCATTTAGVGYCWGNGFNGEIGNGAANGNNYALSPTAVIGGYAWAQFTSGADVMMGIVKTSAPWVTSVTASAANGTIGTGVDIDITITFSENVNVTGSPKLELETGTTDRSATYLSGSGTNTLTFRYTTQSGDSSSDLNYQSTSSLSLNGGTIRDADLNDASLVLPELYMPTSLGGGKNLVITAP